VRGEPQGASAEEAVRLLARQQGEEAAAALRRLPDRWRDSAPVIAHGLLAALPRGGAPQPLDAQLLAAGLAALQRWPEDSASRDLQWELTRRALLAQSWGQAERLLGALPADRQPPPLAARHRFWRGVVQQRRGRPADAAATWRTLRWHHPGGYYGWRAAVRLGTGELRWTPGPHGSGPAAAAAESWAPLASGDAGLDRLWRLDQHTEAWETWRTARGGRMPQDSGDLLVEGRLRQGVGDDWTGFDQLERATLRLDPARCDLLPQLERSLHPPRFMDIFGAAARHRGLPIELLLGLAKQESRFTPNVRSVAGAVGLMQLLPSTASEVAGRPVSAEELEDPALNAELGAGYLAALLRRWNGNPFLLAASYNAGPGAAAGWIDPRLEAFPELWAEAIPYPETRLYVKKVLGNAWSYQVPETPRC
jgi:soluble lytic murein transglycosylase